MDYQIVCDRIEGLAGRGWSHALLAEADGYPVFMLQHNAPGGDRPSLLIDAGIHGEEPASVAGLLDWLERRAEPWLTEIDFTVFPCLNPWGFERGVRCDPRGRDLNREFNNPVHPAVAGFCKAIAGRRFDLFMDLHEDCDFLGMYLYEVACVQESAGSAASPTLGRKILDAGRTLVPLSDGDDVDGLITSDGLISAPITREELSEWEWWPIALYAYVHHTDHVITVETPGRQPFDLRRSLHGTALDVACAHLTGRGNRTS